MRPIGTMLLLVCLAACGPDGSAGSETPAPTQPPTSNPAPAPTPTPSTANVSMRSADDGNGDSSHSFDPQRVTIARSGTVTWSNETNLTHNVTFTTAGSPASIPNHFSGDNSRQFPTAGTFAYSCTNHAGMSGDVVVVAP